LPIQPSGLAAALAAARSGTLLFVVGYRFGFVASAELAGHARLSNVGKAS